MRFALTFPRAMGLAALALGLAGCSNPDSQGTARR